MLENVTQVLRDPRAGIPIKGKHPPIGPGTDKGLYNVDYFEGDILIPAKPNGVSSWNTNIIDLIGEIVVSLI